MQLEKTLNAILILIFCFILLSAYGVQFIYKEEPCPLCLLQRIGMISVSMGAFLNLRFGIKTSHYGLSLLSALFGGTVALRQIALHVCPGFSTFGFPVLGLSLYTWSFVAFACSVFYIAILLCLHDRQNEKDESFNYFYKFTGDFLLLIAFSQVITTFFQCGFSICGE